MEVERWLRVWTELNWVWAGNDGMLEKLKWMWANMDWMKERLEAGRLREFERKAASGKEMRSVHGVKLNGKTCENVIGGKGS